MAYQIPQQLEYKEKIMFGLTFKQLAYAFVFGLITIIFFRIMPPTFNFISAVLISCLGIGFMFFDFSTRLKDYWYYYRFRNIALKEKEVDSFLGISKAEGNIIISSQNKKIAILKINPINFSIKPNDEKDSIMLAFQKFLNSLDFPTQIIMNTESLNLSEYLLTLRSHIEGKEYINIFNNYREFLEETIESNKIMNRVFYLVIPEQTNIENQVTICMERFASLNLKVERLNNGQLRELLNKFIPNRPEKQKNFLEIKNNVNNLEINKIFHRIIYAHGYPRTVEGGFLDRIVSLQGDFNLSLQIKPYPIENMLVDLNKELQKQRSDLFAMQSKGVINPSLEIQYSDTRSTLETLQKGDERLFNVSLYITCKAETEDKLNLLTKKVEAELNSIMVLPRIAKFRMLQGFRSVLPLGIDELKANRNITTAALSAFFPFTSQFLQADKTGVWLGLNKNNIPIIKDIFKLSNPNGVVLAQSGGGKSYFCKLLITRYLLNGTKVIIIDPQGEYKSLVNRFGGQVIDLSRESNTLINPLDLMGHDYTEKRLSLMDLIPVMLGNISEPQKAFLDKAITETYKSKGINMIPDTWINPPPIMGDLLENLEKLAKKATQVESATLRSVINRMDMYVSGVFSFLNRHTNIKFDNKLVCFDLGNMPKQIKPVVMFLLLDFVYMKMKSDLNRKILLVDEAWTLLSRTEDASYILEIVKTCRKFNLGLLLINQEVEDLFNSRAGKSVLANSAYTLLLKQKPSVINSICDSFHLSQYEREHLLTANVGEGLLIMEDEHSKIKVVASPEEDKIITTKADEILIREKTEKRNSGKLGINVDLDKRFYKRKELKENEIKYLISEGYKPFSQQSIVSGTKEDYILKPRHNESLNHMFVIYDIFEFLKSKGVSASMYTTRMPDIVFTHNKKIYAIEVETGSVIEHEKRLKEKIKLLENQKYNEWFFVVTNRNLVKRYKKFGQTLDSRFIVRKLKNLLK